MLRNKQKAILNDSVSVQNALVSSTVLIMVARVPNRYLGIDGEDWVKLGLACSIGLNVALFGVIALKVEPFKSQIATVFDNGTVTPQNSNLPVQIALHDEGFSDTPNPAPEPERARSFVKISARIDAPQPRPRFKDQSRLNYKPAALANRISDAFYLAPESRQIIDLSLAKDDREKRNEAFRVALRGVAGEQVFIERSIESGTNFEHPFNGRGNAPSYEQAGRVVKVERITAASLVPMNKKSAERVASLVAPSAPGPDAARDLNADVSASSVNKTLALVPKDKSVGQTAQTAQAATGPALNLSSDLINNQSEALDKANEKSLTKVAALNRGASLSDANPVYSIAPLAETPSVGRSAQKGIFSALRDLKLGLRTKPITIVHIGDSHVASDSFSQGIRRGLQEEYGDAGRGMLIPAGAFKYGVAAGVSMKKSGSWKAATSHRTKSGPYGLSGVRLSSSSSSAALTLSSKSGQFDWAEVTVVTGPEQGKVRISVGDKIETFNARATKLGSKVVRVKAAGAKATVKPAGGGVTTVLNWAIGNDRPGVRYVNFGLIGAQASVTKRWSSTLVKNDLKHLDPDLVVWGYGTNEGFNDNLSIDRYSKTVKEFIGLVEEAAPRAELLFIGPASSARLPRFAGKSSSTCRVLSDEQQKNYSSLLKKRSSTLAAWHEPPKLNTLRALFEDLAQEYNGYYWDWSKAMGGACSIDKWARSSPKLAAGDRVHLQMRGYQKSADQLVQFLTQRVEKLKVASAE